MTVGAEAHKQASPEAVLQGLSLLKESWVQCDGCSKWRRVPKQLADELRDDTPWYCKFNPAKDYAACKVPQELSDEEIDRAISNDEDFDADAQRRLHQHHPAVWQLVVDNLYTHRKRRKQDEDDIMICQCKPPQSGSTGCGDQCLNRLLNLECTPGYCPCGDQCSNQMFSQRHYANLDKRRAGAKGFGLFTKADLKAGQFVMEYVGEVLEEEEYMRRKEYYHEINQRHYYFMNIGNGEIIDACRKGGLGRFINHSCAPNCETQKWLVHGELAIGLFALQDIPAHSELTFDYNFERYGDKPLRCLCGSSSCRGFVGGTQENIISREVHDPADASEDLEPIMVGEREAGDPLLAAILESEIGLLTNSFDADAALARLKDLAAQRGIEVDWSSVRDEETAKASLLSACTADNTSRTSAQPDAPPSAASTQDGQRPASPRSAPHARPLEGVRPGGQATISPASGDSDSGGDDIIHAAESRGIAHHAEGRGDTAAGVHGKEEVMQAKGAQASSSMASSTSTATVALPARKPPREGGLEALALELLPEPSGVVRRRSEVDRKLDALLGASGKLREASPAVAVKFLRLFNLCDFSSGPQGSSAAAAVMHMRGQGQPRPGSGSMQSSFFAGSPVLQLGHSSVPCLQPIADSSPAVGSGRSYLQNGRRLHAASRPEAVEPTARQRARMADLSLLLDVVLKTSNSLARKQLCACGVVRQLQVVLGRCEGPQHAVVLRKVLRVVESLPLTPDDLHTVTSAQGCFADTLRELVTHPYLDASAEVRTQVAKLLLRHALAACSPEVQKQAAIALQARNIRQASVGTLLASVTASSSPLMAKPPPVIAALLTQPPAQSPAQRAGAAQQEAGQSSAAAVLPSGKRSRFGPAANKPVLLTMPPTPVPDSATSPGKRLKTEHGAAEHSTPRLPAASPVLQSPAAAHVKAEATQQPSWQPPAHAAHVPAHVTPAPAPPHAGTMSGLPQPSWHAAEKAPAAQQHKQSGKIMRPMWDRQGMHAVTPAWQAQPPTSPPLPPPPTLRPAPHPLASPPPPHLPPAAPAQQPQQQADAITPVNATARSHAACASLPASRPQSAQASAAAAAEQMADARPQQAEVRHKAAEVRHTAPHKHHSSAHKSHGRDSGGRSRSRDRRRSGSRDRHTHRHRSRRRSAGSEGPAKSHGREAGSSSRPASARVATGAHSMPEQPGGVVQRRVRRSSWDVQPSAAQSLALLRALPLAPAAGQPLSAHTSSRAEQCPGNMLPAGLESPVTPPHDPSAYAVLSTQPVDTDNNQLPPPPLPEEPEPGELPAGAPQPHAAAAAVNVQNSDDLPSLDDGPADAEGQLQPVVSSVQASSWERPDLGFEAFVARLVQSRLHKYARTDHPFHISAAAAAQLFKKARRTIIDNERQAFNDRARNNAQKPIERSRVEPRIRDYVRDSVKRLHDRGAVAGS